MKSPLGAQVLAIMLVVLTFAFPVSAVGAIGVHPRGDAPAAGDLRDAIAPLPPAELLATAVAPVASEVQLSDEHTYTRWAHPLSTSLIRAAPLPDASAVGRLHPSTEEGEPEVYLLLDQLTNTAGITWVRLRVPGRPNGRTGWVRRGNLGAFHLTHWALSVNLSRLRATLFLDGRKTWSAPIGVGSPTTPTPVGHFWIRELLRVPGHTLYGPFAFGTSDYSVLSEWPHGGVVGIHGTNQPQLIPGRPSHGCIRMSNPDIVYLAHHLPIGAPVNILA